MVGDGAFSAVTGETRGPKTSRDSLRVQKRAPTPYASVGSRFIEAGMPQGGARRPRSPWGAYFLGDSVTIIEWLDSDLTPRQTAFIIAGLILIGALALIGVA